MATRQTTFDKTTEKRDFRAEFTAKVVDAIESGKPLPWERTWGTSMETPRNAISDKPYNGMNRLFTAIHMIDRGYTDPRFVTFKQAQDLGGSVKKGEKGVQIEKWNRTEFWQRRDVEVTQNGRPVKVVAADRAGAHLDSGATVPKASLAIEHGGKNYDWAQAENELTRVSNRVYTVFNVQQCKDLKLEPLPQRDQTLTPEQRLLHIEQSLAEQTGLQFATGPQPLYRVRSDTVVTPEPSAFKTLGDYQSTRLHEIGHATGAEKRLNRPMLTQSADFGSPEYAREELRAELFSAFAGMETGITRTRDEQHMSYLKSWAEALKKDPNEIFRAAKDAAQAVDYVVAQEKAFDLKVDRILQAVNGPQQGTQVEKSPASPQPHDKPAQEAEKPGLKTLSHTELKVGHDVVDHLGRMQRIVEISSSDANRTITREKNLDTGAENRMVYTSRDQIYVTDLSIKYVKSMENDQRREFRIEDAKKVTGTFKAVEPALEPGRERIAMTRAGTDILVNAPEGTSRGMTAGTPAVVSYDPKKGVQIEAIQKGQRREVGMQR